LGVLAVVPPVTHPNNRTEAITTATLRSLRPGKSSSPEHVYVATKMGSTCQSTVREDRVPPDQRTVDTAQDGARQMSTANVQTAEAMQHVMRVLGCPVLVANKPAIND
jgi:hypothetical protein